MPLTPLFRGYVRSDGVLTLPDEERGLRRAHLLTLVDQHVDVAISLHKDTRSARANRYYWGVVLTEISKAHSAGDQSVQEIHDAMCAQFLPNEKLEVEFFNLMTGEVIVIETDHRRSSKLTGTPFYEFVEKVRKFALEVLGVRTEDPDPEYWRRATLPEEAA